MSILKTQNLSYIYGENTPFKKDAVTDISVEFNKGELVGIIGHTGSGKSTLVQCLNGLLHPGSGKVFYNDADVWANPKKIRDLRFKVGLVFQYPEHQLFDQTVFDDISFGPKNIGLSADEIKHRVNNAAKLVGLPESELAKSPFDLSGGQKRRAAIAGVLAMEPEVLILDEPTAGLDPRGRETIFELVLKYREATDAAVIFVSHSMEDIASFAERVLVMQNGKVKFFDKTREVFLHAGELADTGLDIPQITKVFMGLKQKGVNVETDVYTVDEAVKRIKSIAPPQSIKGGVPNA